jgi:GWxTD domain-containing protein
LTLRLGRVDTRCVTHSRGLGAATILLLLLAPAVHPAVARAAHAREAESLYDRARVEEKRGTLESRREALGMLERATVLAPDSVTYQLELARLYYSMGFLGQARKRYERVAKLDPDRAEGHLGQGLVWRRDYLKYLEPSSLERSLAELEVASRLAPDYAETWIQLVPLLVERGRLEDALHAAERAHDADPGRPDGLLAVAHTAFRLGQVERADSAFRAAIPRLPRVARERFVDIAPLAAERDTSLLRRLSVAGREAFLKRFWKDQDPDLVTTENEAQLEYWSRVTQAYFLFFSARRQEWDQRGEVYVRYGPPEKAIYNPVGTSLWFQVGRYGSFPMNVLVWRYPGLGMTVPMHDRLLSEYYMPPMSMVRSTDPVPDPDSLARRTGSFATGGGRGVFPVLPPGITPLPLRAVLGRFEGEEGPRLMAWLETPGAPSDSLWGEWTVLDSNRTEVARVRRPLAASACDVSALRAADFATLLPPGDYVAGFSVEGEGGRRGVHRSAVRLEAQVDRLALSDLLVSCGTPQTEFGAAGPSLRLSANPGARVAGSDPLTAYFEAYHLQPGSDGRSRLEFEYVVRSAERDPRIWIQRLVAPRPSFPDISATRQEEQTGAIRRQAVSVPVQTLPPGRYRLEIRVRDLNAGTEAARSALFEKVGTAGS